MNLNTDEDISTVLIKNQSILHFNHRYGFWSSLLLFQLELLKALVFEKVCFNLIKLSLFCFIYFFCLLLFFISFRFFVSFVFTGARTIPLKENCPALPPVKVRVGVSFRVRARVGGQLSLGAIALEPLLPIKKRGFFTCQQNFRFYSFIICAKLHLFVDATWTKWSKLDDVHIFQ